MSPAEDAQRSFLDMEALAGELLAPGGVFAFLAAHRDKLFPDPMMEDLFFSKGGRPSIPPPVIGSGIVLQALQGLSDRETADALTFSGSTETAFHRPH